MTKLILKLVFAVNLFLRLFYFFGDSFCLVHHWRFSASLLAFLAIPACH
jgi:hypothetical protein